MRRFLSITIVCLVALGSFALVGCQPKKPVVDAADTVRAAIDSFILGDTKGFYSYVNVGEGAAAEDEEEAYVSDIIGKKVTYEIVSSNEDIKKGTARVKVKIVAPDLTAVEKETEKQVRAKITKSSPMTEEEVRKLVYKIFAKVADSIKETKTTEVEVTLGLIEKGDDVVWKIDNEALYAPLFGESGAVETETPTQTPEGTSDSPGTP